MSEAGTTLRVRRLGRPPYGPVFDAMKAFTDARSAGTADELWLVEHEPVFTQGQAGKEEHLLMPGDIPVVQVDRGGQVTYHGPGQVVAYPMLDLRRLDIGVRQLVTGIENAIVATLADCGITAYPKADAPGVYVKLADAGRADDEAKIASLGIRIRRGCSYHGLSLNVDMDLAPFLRINPCGYQGLEMTRISDLLPAGQAPSMAAMEDLLLQHLLATLGYQRHDETDDPFDILAETVHD